MCESALELGLVQVSSLGWGFGFRVWASGMASVCQIALGVRISGVRSRAGVGVWESVGVVVGVGVWGFGLGFGFSGLASGV